MIKVNVEINNKSWHKKIKNPKKYFNKKLKKITKIIKFFKGKKIIFTILLTKSSMLKKLNKKFRNKNKSTDVLSFPLSKKTRISKITYIHSSLGMKKLLAAICKNFYHTQFYFFIKKTVI